ncbi:MAG: translation initiation factor IF-2, partial [Dolichospermum sp.]
MNNGKVRIYDLSKELNLDNKELLAICDQLDIAVKSHSSTISESVAQQIRTAAQKLMAANLAAKKAAKKEQGTNGPGQNSFPNHKSINHKQQILEIRKPKILRNTTTNTPDASVATAADANHPSPPRTFATPVSPMKPTAPTRPVPRSQSETPHKPNITPPEQGSHPQPAGEKVIAEKPEKISAPRPKPEKPQKPPLVSPPARADGTKPSEIQGVSEKPVLKRDRQQRAEENTHPIRGKGNKSSSDQNPIPAPSKPSRATSLPTKPEQRSGKPVPGGDIQRPRPARPSEAVTATPIATPPRHSLGGKKEVLDSTPILPDILDLKRPTPPRINKGGKKWKEEEIIDEIKEKAKIGPKGKRSKPILEDDLLDEEDLLDEGLGEISAAVQVSLSIARPPKPKGTRTAGPTVAVVAAPTTRGKKSSSARDQHRRQESCEEKPDRPAILAVTGPLTVPELADALVIADTEIVKILFMKGMAVSITQNLDIPTITLVAKELEVEVEIVEREAEARKITEMIDAEDLDHLIRRPPVVTIMGHVDHGKTTLLDSIRKTKVAAGEAGGITQHIGAYHVDIVHEGKPQQIVFLDTPGHEAFTAMRARGARVTDIAVLVVAADDGVRPQTMEAISHAKAADVPIVVAINKIDKEGAQPERVKQELTNYGLTAEDWGGETIMVPVSAIRGENLDTLLEMIMLVSEVAELSANPERSAKGTVIEAHLDKAKGAVATLLIQNGTLRVGDMLVAGSAFGKVRAMVNDRGKRVDVATPSFAVEVLGLSDVPAAGDDFEVYENEKEARSIASDRAEKQRQSRLLQGRVTLTTLSAQAQEGELKELNLILKA